MKAHSESRGSGIKYIIIVSMLLQAASVVHGQCIVTGCTPGECYVESGSNKCSKCLDGYYRTSTLQICNVCQSRCLTCSSFSQCLTCKVGYYFDQSQNFCSSCSNKCSECTSGSSCTKCEEGYSTNSNGSCEEATQTDSTSDNKSTSLVGQIVGYCISGCVLILCCVITLLHQKRKQEEEEAARKAYKEEQDKIERANGRRDEEDIVEDQDFDRGSGNIIPIDFNDGSKKSRVKPFNMGNNASNSIGDFKHPKLDLKPAVGGESNVLSIGSYRPRISSGAQQLFPPEHGKIGGNDGFAPRKKRL